MDMTLLILDYSMPTLMALSVLYFFYAMSKFNNAGSYSEDDKAVDMLFKALAVMFVVVNAWLLITLFTSLL